MAKLTKSAPWLNLITGLLFLFTFIRDRRMPDFLSISGRHYSDPWLQLTTAALLFISAAIGFLRRNRDSKDNAPPAVTTLFGPHSD